MLLLDPSGEEEAVMDGYISYSVNAHGLVHLQWTVVTVNNIISRDGCIERYARC